MRSRERCVLIDFFFQAEDGIRDRNVTGVQTCALPICWTWSSHGGGPSLGDGPARAPRGASTSEDTAAACGPTGPGGGIIPAVVGGRSEERRVGKERRRRVAAAADSTKERKDGIVLSRG